VGAYTAGNDPNLDRAIASYPRYQRFLQQSVDEHITYDQAIAQLDRALNGHSEHG